MAEFHDLAELALNREGQSWGNLGYWKSETEYSDACRALAILLGEQAGLDRQSVLFDAGFGCGDQLLLWLDHFRVARVRGVNLSCSQTAYARTKLVEAGFEDSAAAIVPGDINDPGIWQAATGTDRPSHLLALDCAYHFPSRLEFIAQARRHLAPAGRIALTDFMLSDHHRTGSVTHCLLRWMLKRSHIAEANIVHPSRYLDQLRQAGFDEVRIVDISKHVMPGFAHFIRTFRVAGKAGWAGWLKYAVTSRFLQWAYGRSILRYCLVSATKAR
ncbi:hypothetical protein C8024_17830 [Sphingopyxis sp. BSNA05]|uniref:hypothetical protein n=1 Tax=Sphingopyxis sp. BSNA05 TaxID=1236614 RepID=UPI001564C6E8|nr:hypothetical protein [Sphingopyxis sp. BSNA05]NRD90910.1 hypothetical protein [Sphingopyxis sp. BSNA05]